MTREAERHDPEKVVKFRDGLLGWKSEKVAAREAEKREQEVDELLVEEGLVLDGPEPKG
jgi:hypothetical protein